MAVMSMNSRRFRVAAGLLGAWLVASAPALAQHGGGGGGGHGGGGGGGFHSSGGGHASGGVGGSHGSTQHFGGAPGGGAHYVGGGGGIHYGGGTHYGSSSVHAYAGGGFHGNGYGGRGGYGYPGGGYRHGYSTGAYWGGGYWRGGYWPRAYYGFGYSWFLPVLPLAYATYWYGGVPYYYANDVYYTWNPDYDGYTASDPPPVAEGGDGSDGSAVPPAGAGQGQGQGQPSAQNSSPSMSDQIFMYPKNGQSEQQQSQDKRECQQWAGSQAGQGAANGNDYRRAMLACVEGRGYSAN